MEPSKTWIRLGMCGGCGKRKDLWTRTTKFKCCRKACTDVMNKNYVYVRWRDIRIAVFRRDKFVCNLCKMLTPAPEQDITAWRAIPVDEGMIKLWVEQHQSTLLVADHVIPIALGGEEWSLENIQTLCQTCNKIKTRADIGMIAVQRKKEKLISKGQQLLRWAITSFFPLQGIPSRALQRVL